MKKHHCQPEHAQKFLDWIANRGGIAVWKSCNLSNLDRTWSGPAMTDGKPTQKPSWEAEESPSRIITSADEVEVMTDKEVKRFRVAVRRSSNGMSWKVTDAGSRRIRAAVDKAGENAYHEFDYSTQEAVIYSPDKIVPLNEWRPA